MHTFYCLISAKEANESPANLGWAYCLAHKSEWIKGNDETDRYNTIGHVIGVDFAVHDGKVYSLHKAFQDLDNKCTVILCKESVMGCDKID